MELIDRMIGRPKFMYLAQLLSQDQPRCCEGRDPSGTPAACRVFGTPVFSTRVTRYECTRGRSSMQQSGCGTPIRGADRFMQAVCEVVVCLMLSATQKVTRI